MRHLLDCGLNGLHSRHLPLWQMRCTPLSVTQLPLQKTTSQQRSSLRSSQTVGPYCIVREGSTRASAASPAVELLRSTSKSKVAERLEEERSDGLEDPLGLELFLDNSLDGCEPWSRPLRVAVLLSGGVDSTVALRLLQQAGHHVTAFYLQIWFQEDFRNTWDACPWEEDVRVCQQVCAQLSVALEVVPLTEQYWRRVVAASMAEIRAGRTPNPDIMCNSHVKFGAFVDFLDVAHPGAFDRIASGHYARLLRPAEPGALVQLAMTGDAVKDQTYFLARLRQAQLRRLMFPLAPLTKAGVRRLAAAERLPNQARPDSQGICFLGKVRFAEFVREHLGDWQGPIVEEESGAVVGFHQGYWFYTIGQRKGIQLAGGPWFVCHKDVRTNVVYVSKQYHAPDKCRNAFRCGSFNWIGGCVPDKQLPLHCKVRHGPGMYLCRLTLSKDGTSADVLLDQDDQGLAPGQSAAFYQHGVCLGSGIILHAL